MSRTDPKDIRAQKRLLAIATLLSVAVLVAAPFLGLDLSYLVLALGTVSVAFTALRTVCVLRFVRGIRDVVRRYFSPASGQPDPPPLAWTHVVVVPIYKEPLDTIAATHRALSVHRDARERYVVVCAQEATVPDRDEKFEAIRAEFGHCFRELVQTTHVLAADECPGKASNVNHAVRAYVAGRSEIDPSSVMVTVIDTDTLINEFYFHEVERLAASAENPHATIYAAPAIFESNRGEVPCFVRSMDDLWSLAAAANIFSNTGLGFPISNYTVPLRLVLEIDYWDYDYDAVGEDFHMFVKAFIKTGGKVGLAAVGVPMNNANVQSSTYLKSVATRYYQALRHALGISTTAYYLKFATTSRPSRRKLALLALCMEAHLFPMLYFGAGMYAYLCFLRGELLVYFGGAKLWYLAALTTVGIVLFNTAFFSYKYAQRIIRRTIFGIDRPGGAKAGLRAALDYVVQGYCVVGYFILPFTFRTWQNLSNKERRQYYSKGEEKLRVDA